VGENLIFNPKSIVEHPYPFFIVVPSCFSVLINNSTTRYRISIIRFGLTVDYCKYLLLLVNYNTTEQRVTDCHSQKYVWLSGTHSPKPRGADCWFDRYGKFLSRGRFQGEPTNDWCWPFSKINRRWGRGCFSEFFSIENCAPPPKKKPFILKNEQF